MPLSFSFAIKVYIEDTDAGGIVYHANYIKFAERARTEWLHAHGIRHYLFQEDYSFVVSHLEIAYKKPAFMGDLLIATVEPINKTAATGIIKQSILKDTILLAELTVTLACINSQFKPRRLPPEVAVLFDNIS